MLRNVMVIDDDLDFCEMLTVYLESASFVVRAMQDGLTALEELRNNPYDLLVLDISLPQMNGFRVLNAIRGNPEFKHIPVMILTANDDKASVVRVQGEVSDYVIKPLNREDFLFRVDRILASRQQIPQIFLEGSDRRACGRFEVSVRLRSISTRGAILSSPVLAPKAFVLHTLKLALMQDLGVLHRQFKVAACTGDMRGGFTYFISFLDLSAVDQRKIRDWIRAQASDASRTA